MPARLTAAPMLLAVAVFAASVGLTGADAKDIACGPGEVSVPDDREEGGNLCVSKAEWEKAKTICSANAAAGDNTPQGDAATPRDAPALRDDVVPRDDAAPSDDADPTACLCQDGDRVGACGD